MFGVVKSVWLNIPIPSIRGMPVMLKGGKTMFRWLKRLNCKHKFKYITTAKIDTPMTNGKGRIVLFDVPAKGCIRCDKKVMDIDMVNSYIRKTLLDEIKLTDEKFREIYADSE